MKFFCDVDLKHLLYYYKNKELCKPQLDFLIKYGEDCADSQIEETLKIYNVIVCNLEKLAFVRRDNNLNDIYISYIVL